jgi:hypothetical protein
MGARLMNARKKAKRLRHRKGRKLVAAVQPAAEESAAKPTRRRAAKA